MLILLSKSITSNNMKNEIKTTLFASLIVAMILPFSSMDGAYAVEQSDLQTKQQKIIDRMFQIEERIAKTSNADRIQVLEDRKQVLLKKLMDNVSHVETVDTTNEDVSNSNQAQTASAGSQYNINIVKKGCNGANQTANIAGVMTNGNSWFTMYHAYPSSLSVGSSPNCTGDNWANNHYVKAKDVFTGVGCQANLNTANIASYSLNCQTPIAGFWVVEVRGDYGTTSMSGYTYVVV